MDEPAYLWICVTCHRSMAPGVASVLATDGRELFDLARALLAGQAAAGRVVLQAVKCMSGCERACTVSLSAAGKPSYMFGDLEPTAEHAGAVLDCAFMYATRPDGLLTRIERPSALRKGILSRIPTPLNQGPTSP